MTTTSASVPACRSDLIVWRERGSDRYLVRDRRAGETFRIGEEEHFLLSHLDGRQTPEEICATFGKRFNQPLTREEIDEFAELAGERDYRLRRLLYVPRPDDIFIVTYPRSGTTWMQMILYQLTTDGNMDFPHIAEFCPWFEASGRSARGFETRPSPRLFKTHMPWNLVPKGASRYIYVARRGTDMVVSYYHLRRNYSGYEGTFDEFFERFLKGKAPHGSWFDHVRGWWEHRDDPNVLFLTYEELSRDLEGSVRRIAAFIGQDVPPDRMPVILERCSFAYMKQYEDKFDPVLEQLWEQGVQLKSFLRQGCVGAGAISLTDEQQARFDEASTCRLKALGVPLS